MATTEFTKETLTGTRLARKMLENKHIAQQEAIEDFAKNPIKRAIVNRLKEKNKK